ncbi:topoisomerase C-terminal repeat-containing protein, partial [Candidatus Liberibacter sp.]|uniref:topoisomerase C-terminal repeat-containing protein n=1 Tax=Candidatus Liberibacter sp. TaxID=34022 RepID=UPI0015F7357A
DDDDCRTCPACKNHQLSLKISKYGAFVGCTNYPECHYTRQLTSEKQATSDILEQNEPKSLGIDLLTHESVTLRSGRFGFYVQCGEGKNSKRCSLPKDWSKDDIDYTKAMSLLSLPREIGAHPETGKSIFAGTGRYGLYLNHDGNYVKLESIEQVLTINLDQAVSHLTEKLKDKKSPRRNSKGLEVGVHPDGGIITLHSGRYGPYISWGKINASLPKSESLEQITLQDSLKILESKIESKKKKRKNPD